MANSTLKLGKIVQISNDVSVKTQYNKVITYKVFHGSFARGNHYPGKPVIDRIGGNTQKIIFHLHRMDDKSSARRGGGRLN